MATLKELIEKVIPLKGILRTPSYWMRRVLISIADAVEAVQTNLDKVNNQIGTQNEILTKSILYAKTGQPFFVLGEASKPKLDGTYIDAEPYKIYKGSFLHFHNENNSVFKVTFIISAGMKSLDFSNCVSLTSLDVSNFDTSAVTDMGSMFSGCRGLTSLDLGNFNTSAVTSMNSMFSYCDSLTSLDLSSFDTSAVTDMYGMFNGCTALRNIKCKQAFKDWCVANASTLGLTVENITWEIVE